VGEFMEYNIPEGWEWVKLGEVCNTREEQINPLEMKDENVYVDLEHIKSDEWHLSNYGSPKEVEDGKNKFYAGDILYGKPSQYLNKAVLSDIDGACSTDILVLTPDIAKIYSKYLLIAMSSESFLNFVNKTMQEMNPQSSWDEIKSFEFLLPPLEKQKQIIDKIEYLFKDLDNAIELKQKSIGETRGLFSSVLNKIFREIADKEGWELVKLNEITSMEELDNILISDIGRISTSINNDLYNKFIYYFIKHYFSIPNENAIDSEIPLISKEVFDNLSIPIPYKNNQPNLERQLEIVNYLDILTEKIKRLEELQERELNIFRELKESILNKAFNGELV
jgi:restriction endonuclease S subunit